jgi:hypothetical protein
VCPCNTWYGTRTVSPGKAMIRFTSISLGLIGELTNRGEKYETERNAWDVVWTYYRATTSSLLYS